MHPAGSVILFTTASGAGYGLLAWMALAGLAGVAPLTSAFGLAGLGLAFALVTLGLASSTFHLGRPERAWRAFSQWRSSWLSREGVAAVATYAVAAPFSLGWVFFRRLDGLLAVSAALTLALTFVTVICTAMIYASLKPIRQWSVGWTAPVYLTLAAATGALLFVDLTSAFGAYRPIFALAALAALALAGAVKLGYWRAIDAAPAVSLLSATGLGRYGSVRLLDPPHTEENFVLREMGFRIARKHAKKLRRLVLGALFAAPATLTLAAAFAPGLVSVCVGLATLSAALGVGVERWLFFAEATHVSTVYYGRAA